MNAESDDGPIHGCIERWHRLIRGDLPGGLDELLHDECVFFSPIVFTPQRGREVTKMYLQAAGGTLGGADLDAGDAGEVPLGQSGGFRYTKEILQGHQAMLEFETTIEVDGEPKYANGVDIITCDDAGAIVEFKVMIRPLQAINAVHAQMMAALEQLGSG